MHLKHRFFVLGSLCLSLSVQASLVQKMGTNALTSQSAMIQIGEVRRSWSSYDPEKRMVYTYVKMVVEETLKGTPQKEILLRQPGGQAGGVTMKVHGVAQFKPGEKALVFAQIDADGAPTVTGLAQGKYRIYKDPKTGLDMASFKAPKNLEFASVGMPQQKFQMLNPSEANRELLLTDLVKEIKIAIEAQKGKK